MAMVNSLGTVEASVQEPLVCDHTYSQPTLAFEISYLCFIVAFRNLFPDAITEANIVSNGSCIKVFGHQVEQWGMQFGLNHTVSSVTDCTFLSNDCVYNLTKISKSLAAAYNRIYENDMESTLLLTSGYTEIPKIEMQDPSFRSEINSCRYYDIMILLCNIQIGYIKLGYLNHPWYIYKIRKMNLYIDSQLGYMENQMQRPRWKDMYESIITLRDDLKSTLKQLYLETLQKTYNETIMYYKSVQLCSNNLDCHKYLAKRLYIYTISVNIFRLDEFEQLDTRPFPSNAMSTKYNMLLKDLCLKLVHMTDYYPEYQLDFMISVYQSTAVKYYFESKTFNNLGKVEQELTKCFYNLEVSTNYLFDLSTKEYSSFEQPYKALMDVFVIGDAFYAYFDLVFYEIHKTLNMSLNPIQKIPFLIEMRLYLMSSNVTMQNLFFPISLNVKVQYQIHPVMFNESFISFTWNMTDLLSEGNSSSQPDHIISNLSLDNNTVPVYIKSISYSNQSLAVTKLISFFDIPSYQYLLDIFSSKQFPPNISVPSVFIPNQESQLEEPRLPAMFPRHLLTQHMQTGQVNSSIIKFSFDIKNIDLIAEQETKDFGYLCSGEGWVNFYEWYYAINNKLVSTLQLMGVLTSIMNMIVFLQPEMDNPSNLFLLVLSTIDLVTLIINIPKQFIHGMSNTSWGTATYVLFTYYFSYVRQGMCLIITATLASWRYMATASPFKARIWCTKNNAKKIIALSCLCSLISHIPLFFNVGVKEGSGGYSLNFKIIGPRDYFNMAGVWIAVMLRLLLCSLILALTIGLMHQLRSAARTRAALVQQTITRQTNTPKDRTNVMLIIMLISLLVTTVPHAVLQLLGLVYYRKYINCYLYIGQFITAIENINPVFDSFVYCLMQQYRRSLVYLISSIIGLFPKIPGLNNVLQVRNVTANVWFTIRSNQPLVMFRHHSWDLHGNAQSLDDIYGTHYDTVPETSSTHM